MCQDARDDHVDVYHVCFVARSSRRRATGTLGVDKSSVEMLRAFRESGRRREMRRSGRSGMGRQSFETRCHEETKGDFASAKKTSLSTRPLSALSRHARRRTSDISLARTLSPGGGTRLPRGGGRQTSRLDRRRRRGERSSASSQATPVPALLYERDKPCPPRWSSMRVPRWRTRP